MGQIVIESHSFLEYWQNHKIHVILLADALQKTAVDCNKGLDIHSEYDLARG